MSEFGGSASETPFVFGYALCDFARRVEGIADMRYEIATTHGEAQRRRGIGGTNDVELGAIGVPVPARLHDSSETFGMVRMHVCEEDRVKLPNVNVDLREPQRRAATSVKLQFYDAAIVAVIAVPNKGASTGHTVEEHRAAHRTSQRNKQTGRCLRGRKSGQPDGRRQERCRQTETLHRHSSEDCFIGDCRNMVLTTRHRRGPVLAQTRSAGMSAIRPLLGDKRTLGGQRVSVPIDPTRTCRSSA